MSLNMMKYIALLFTLVSLNLKAQNPEYVAVNASGGHMAYYLVSNLNAEISLEKSKKHHPRYYQAGLGKFTNFGNDAGIQFVLRPGWYTGRKTHHFEFGLGLAFTFYEDWGWLPVYPAPVLAYRIQHPDFPLLFRLGVGVPEGAFVGVGLKLP